MWMDQTLKNRPQFMNLLMLWLAVGSAALLFMPTAGINHLQLASFMSQYAHFVGMLFIASSVFLGLNLLLKSGTMPRVSGRTSRSRRRSRTASA